MAYVLTSISGNLISAASAGYSPTNSAEVSAIASAYATGKQDSLTFGYDADSAISSINGSALAGGGGASYTSPSGTIIVGADTLEGTDSGVGITNLTSFQKSGYFGTTYGLSAGGSSNYPTIFKLSGSTGTLSCRISSNGVYYTSVSVEALNGPVVIPSGSWRLQKNNNAPMNWTAENCYSGTANVQLAHKSDVAVSSITRTRFYDYSTNPATPSTAVSAINGEPIQARSALSALYSQFALYTDDGRPLSAMVTATPYSKNRTIHITGLEVEGSDSAFMPSPYVESGTVTAVPSEWQSSVSATGWTYQWSTDTSTNISRIDISGVNSAGSVSVRMGNYRGDGDLSTSLHLAPYETSVYELKVPFYVDYVYLNVSSQSRASSISSVTFTAYSQESGTVVPLAHASSLPTYGYDGTAITSIDGSAIGGGGGVDSATVSAIASSYAESAVSGKQDALEFAYDADSAISSINGSALAGQGGGASITAVSYDTATQQSSIVTATGFGIAGSATNYPRVSSVYLTDGQTRHIEANTLAPGAAQTSNLHTLLFSPASSMWTTAGVAKGIYSPLQYGTGAGLFMDNGRFKGYLKGNELFVCNTDIGRAARLEVHQSRGSRLGLTGNNGSSTVNLTESELTIVNSSYSTATLGRTKLEFKSSASGTATFSHNYIKLYDTAESATKTISSTSIDYWNGKADSSALSSYVPYSSLEYNTASAISGINGSALAAGSTYSAGEGIDITDDVISVEAPVDIVAGPGIVIDNPDGNTLRVSQASNYEVELYSHTSVANNAANTVLNMNEPVTNFERIRVECWNREFNAMRRDFEFTLTDSTTSTRFIADMDASQSVGDQQRVNIGIGYNSDGNLVDLFHGLFYGNGSSYTNGNDRGLGIHRVVGIHRLANN